MSYGPPMTAEKSEKMAKVFSGFGMGRMRRKATLSDLKVVLAKGKAQADSDGDDDEQQAVDDQACQVIIRCRPSQLGRYGKVCSFSAEPAGRDRFTLVMEPPESEGVKRPRPFRCHRYLGPDVDQEEVFEEGEWVIERTMEGYNSTVLCYGITGAGKSYTMWGNDEESMAGVPGGEASDSQQAAQGFAQRVSHAIFEYIRDHSLQGEVFAVEAQFLQIISEDGTKEKLLDLLAEAEKPLEIKPDGFNPGCYVCVGLTTVPIRSPDEMISMLNRGLARCGEIEQTTGKEAARSHVALIINVESLKEQAGGEPEIQRGKLVLVDLAGSESLKYVQKVKGTNDQTVQRQAITINRILASVASAVNSANDKVPATNHKDSALTLMLKGCVGANARVMLVANISPEFDLMEESQKTLTFAQQMIAAKDTAIPTGHRINREQSSLVNMRNRHQECIRILHEKAIDTNEQQRAERARLQAEFEDLNKRLLTAESATDTLENMKHEQMKKIEEIRNEVSNTMSQELQSLRRQSVQDMELLRRSLSQANDENMNRISKEHEDKIRDLQDDLQALNIAKRAADDQVAQLKMKLSACEQELKWVQSREEDLRREIQTGSEERKELRTQADQLWQKLSGTEAELHRAKAEVEDSKRALELQEVRQESEQREMQSLRLQAQQLEKLRAQIEKVEEDRDAGRRREEDMKEQFAEELHAFQVELEEARQRELDLMNLLSEVQDSIIVAADGS